MQGPPKIPPLINAKNLNPDQRRRLADKLFRMRSELQAIEEAWN